MDNFRFGFPYYCMCVCVCVCVCVSVCVSLSITFGNIGVVLDEFSAHLGNGSMAEWGVVGGIVLPCFYAVR